MLEFTDVLDEYGWEYHTSGAKCRDGWINIKCPWCGRDPYLGYSISSGGCSCWNCGVHKLWEVVREITGLPPKQCFELINRFPRSSAPLLKKRGKLILPNCELGTLHAFHREYLEKRGFDPDQLAQVWGLQGIAQEGGLLRWRIFIPIFLDGEMVSWTTRNLNSQEPRYRSASDEASSIPPSDLLYGIDFCRYSVVICEGPADVWKIGPGAVALLGQGMSSARLTQLSRFPLRVVAFDNERAAQKRAQRLCWDLSVYHGKTINIKLDSNDPGSATWKELEELRRHIT